MSEQVLSIWTVYYKPRDHPYGYFARRHVVRPGGEAGSTRDTLKDDTLEGLRRQIPEGLVCIARHPADDPVIVEVWL